VCLNREILGDGREGRKENRGKACGSAQYHIHYDSFVDAGSVENCEGQVCA